MNRTRQIQRATVAHPDGQRRWDHAYQLLLRWADEVLAAQARTVTQEDDDAHCLVRAGLDQSPTPDPHD